MAVGGPSGHSFRVIGSSATAHFAETHTMTRLNKLVFKV
jgi:hypothetical protein